MLKSTLLMQELVAREEAREGLEAKATLLKKIKTLENIQEDQITLKKIKTPGYLQEDQRKLKNIKTLEDIQTTRNMSSELEPAPALDNSSERGLGRLAVLVITVRRTTEATNYLARSLEPLIR